MTTPDPDPLPIPLGYIEIAVFLGTAPRTPSRWAQRGLLPTPSGYISGTVPYWWDTTIETWSRQTGHGDPDRPALRALMERRRAQREAAEQAAEVQRLTIRIQAMRVDLDRMASAQQAASAAAEQVTRMRGELDQLTAAHAAAAAAAAEAERRAEVAP